MSALLCVAAAWLWPRTRGVRDSLSYIPASGNGYILETVPGGVVFRRSTHYLELVVLYPDEIRPLPGWSLRSAAWDANFKLNIPDPPPVTLPATDVGSLGSGTFVDYRHVKISRPATGSPGFSWKRERSAWGPPVCITSFYTDYSAITVRLWFVVGMLALPSVFMLCRRLLRWYRTQPGHCPVCGYDLRATPHRCPECGAVAAQNKPTSN